MDEYIREYPSGMIIGILTTKPNGDVEARDFNSRMILGFYRKSRNVTTDFYGRTIATGNCVSALIYNERAKKKR